MDSILALFGAIYELFSHDVYSYYMIYAFAIPLLMGVLPYEAMLVFNKYPGRFSVFSLIIAPIGFIGSCCNRIKQYSCAYSNC